MASGRWAAVAFGAAALVVLMAGVGAGAPGKGGSVTVAFQNGLDGYAGAADDGREGAVKLMDDRKAADPRWPNPDYRHLLRFADLEKTIAGGDRRIASASLSLMYFDEWWSVNVYHIALHRSLDGTADRVAPEPEDTVQVYGDRFKEGEKTPRPSWITWKIRPETIAGWVKNPASNRGLVLRVATRDFSRGDEGNYGIKFRGSAFGTARERPKLTVTYSFTGNLPPYPPAWDFRYRGATVGREHVLRWHSPAPADPNGDAVSYDIECGGSGGGWRKVADGVGAAPLAWRTAGLPAADGCRLRIRARDPDGATSPWMEGGGEFRVVREDVAFEVGIAAPLETVRRDVPYGGEFGAAVRLELAKNEYESVQVVIANVNRDVRGLAVEASDLRSASAATLAKPSVTVRQVAYVQTAAPDKYSVAYVGLWPDPLLELPRVDVPVGKVQPLWVTVHAPKETAAGEYEGTLTLRGEGVAPRVLPLRVTVWDVALPTPGKFRAMVIEGGTAPAVLDRLLANRLSPAYLLCGWTWDKPCPPVALKDGRWDFSEVDRLAAYGFQRGMNVYTMARFATPGKFGFPDEYSADFRARFKEFLAAYAAHLAEKGWLGMGHVYNIDEPPAALWPMCRENYRCVKAAAPRVAVMQCLNDPKGVAALAGAVDLWDVYIGQFHQAGMPARLKAGDDAVWAVCCYPATHPNLFIDYPPMDARLIGWLSFAAGVSGFEYWAANSWGDNLKRLGDRPYLAEPEEPRWKTNTFGGYNGDGYLVYPGPNGSVLASMRLENLRDGIEDYEMLALLRERAARAKAQGRNVSAAEKLLAVDPAVCRPDLTYTSDPQVILKARREIARCIVGLGR
ncbi:MAG: DUF6067 family protein [Planctomycetota bacterium]|nr:DUF6067 family protein [Planctomycetota bacterium]